MGNKTLSFQVSTFQRMPDSTQDDGMSHMGALVPTNHAEALYQLAKSRSTRSDKTSQSDLLRAAISQYLTREAAKEDVPGEVRDLLDDDLVADAGEGSEVEA